MGTELTYEYIRDLASALTKIKAGTNWDDPVNLTANEARAIHTFLKMDSK